MEDFEYPIQELLLKFSHANVILRFYGTSNQAQRLMNCLSKKTKKAYRSNKLAFEVSLQQVCTEFEFTKEFDEDISKFLLSDGKYKKYKLKLNCKSKESYECFNTFLLSVNSPENLNFSTILCILSKESIDEYNQMIKTLKNLKIDLNNVENHVFDSKDPKYFSEFYFLYDSFLKSLSETDCTYYSTLLRCHRYNFVYHNINESFFIDNLKQKKLKGVIFVNEPYTTPEKYFTILRETQETYGIKKYQILHSFISDERVNAVATLLNLTKTAGLNLDLTKVVLGYYIKFSSYVVKTPCCFLFKFEGKLKLITANKGVFYYKDRNSLLNGSQLTTPKFASVNKGIKDDVLVFTYFNKIELFNVKESVDCGAQFNALKSIYDGLSPAVQKHSTLYMLINRNIDFVNLVYYERDYIPDSRAKTIRFYVKYNQKKSQFERIMNYVERIPKTTKVILDIEMYYWANPLFHKTIIKIAKQTQVVDLQITTFCFFSEFSDYISDKKYNINTICELLGFKLSKDSAGKIKIRDSEFLLTHMTNFEIH